MGRNLRLYAVFGMKIGPEAALSIIAKETQRNKEKRGKNLYAAIYNGKGGVLK